MPRPRALAAYAASAALHVGALAGLVSLPAPPPRETVAIEVVEVARAAPPVPAAEPAPPPPAPTPEPEVLPRRRPRPRDPPAPRDAPLARAEAPPPPNAPPPADAPPPGPRAPVRVGVAMSSTTEGGTVAAPTGNTLHGELPREGDGADAAPYRSESYLPPTRLRRLPRPIDCDPKRFDYPEAAKRAGIEGRVLLRIVVDERGRVADASVLEEPGHGLGAASVAGVKRHCRYEVPEGDRGPAVTSFVVPIRWELD